MLLTIGDISSLLHVMHSLIVNSSHITGRQKLQECTGDEIFRLQVNIVRNIANRTTNEVLNPIIPGKNAGNLLEATPNANPNPIAIPETTSEAKADTKEILNQPRRLKLKMKSKQ